MVVGDGCPPCRKWTLLMQVSIGLNCFGFMRVGLSTLYCFMIWVYVPPILSYFCFIYLSFFALEFLMNHCVYLVSFACFCGLASFNSLIKPSKVDNRTIKSVLIFFFFFFMCLTCEPLEFDSLHCELMLVVVTNPSSFSLSCSSEGFRKWMIFWYWNDSLWEILYILLLLRCWGAENALWSHYWWALLDFVFYFVSEMIWFRYLMCFVLTWWSVSMHAYVDLFVLLYL